MSNEQDKADDLGAHYFSPQQLEQHDREARNAVLEEAAQCIEISGSRSRVWLAELIRNLKRAS